MSRATRFPGLAAAGTVLGILVAVWSAALPLDHLRAVDVLALFAGGFASGAGVVGLVTRWRARKRGGGPEAPSG